MKNIILVITITFIFSNKATAQNYFRMRVTKAEFYCVKCWDKWKPNGVLEFGPTSDPAMDLVGKLSILYNNKSIPIFDVERNEAYKLKTGDVKKVNLKPNSFINIDPNITFGKIELKGNLYEIDDEKSSANDVEFLLEKRDVPIKINDIFLFNRFPNNVIFTFFDSKSDSRISLVLEIIFENNNDHFLSLMENSLNKFLLLDRHDAQKYNLMSNYWRYYGQYYEKVQTLGQKKRFDALKERYSQGFNLSFLPDILQNKGYLQKITYFEDKLPIIEKILIEPSAELITFQKNGENRIGRIVVDEGNSNFYRLILNFELLPFNKSFIEELEESYNCRLDFDLIFPINNFSQSQVVINGIIGIIQKSGRQVSINLNFGETNLAEQYLKIFNDFNENKFSLRVNESEILFKTYINNDVHSKLLKDKLSIEKNFEQEINSIQFMSKFPVRSFYKPYNKEGKPLYYIEVFITYTNENLPAETIGPFGLASQEVVGGECMISLYCKNQRTVIRAFGYAYYDYGHVKEIINEVEIIGCGYKSINIIPSQ